MERAGGKSEPPSDRKAGSGCTTVSPSGCRKKTRCSPLAVPLSTSYLPTKELIGYKERILEIVFLQTFSGSFSTIIRVYKPLGDLKLV